MFSNIEYLMLDGLIIISIFSLILAILWEKLRNFFHNNYSYFDFIFVIAYFMEQLTLITLLVLEPQKIIFWVSIFALLVITTASIQKLSMDSRDRKIRELNIKIKYSSERKSEIIENLGSQIKNLSDYINELENNLNGDY